MIEFYSSIGDIALNSKLKFPVIISLLKCLDQVVEVCFIRCCPLDAMAAVCQNIFSTGLYFFYMEIAVWSRNKQVTINTIEAIGQVKFCA
ncbi:MAG: hypothetical protein CBD37_03475 [Cyanobacteria bacterium TMED177]|nr:MAG: hypothetical protein CBD37_03475 [Cyanobacteria bacterium TMED177]